MIDKLREAFEQWYATSAFNYERDPIGSRDCGLQWEAFQAGHAHAMRGEKVYRLEVKVDGDWRPYDDNFLSGKEEAQGYIHLFGMDPKKARIVTYIRQEEV